MPRWVWATWTPRCRCTCASSALKGTSTLLGEFESSPSSEFGFPNIDLFRFALFLCLVIKRLVGLISANAGLQVWETSYFESYPKYKILSLHKYYPNSRWLWGRKSNLTNFGTPITTYHLPIATPEILLKTATVDIEGHDSWHQWIDKESRSETLPCVHGTNCVIFSSPFSGLRLPIFICFGFLPFLFASSVRSHKHHWG